MKKLNQIIPKNVGIKSTGNLDLEISGLCFDSRKVTSGDLFFALQGFEQDGNAFISSAIENGAVAVVCSVLPENPVPNIGYLVHPNPSKMMGLIASNFYGNPSSKMEVIGVTGTNGKTTITSLLYQLFKSFGYKCGLISTVEININGKIIPTTHTTPDSLKIQSVLADMMIQEVDFVFMEVSSHSVVQERISGIDFKLGIFTNLTHDHLDFHKTFENYRDAKKGFFDGLPFDAFVLINSDDKNGKFMVQNCKAAKFFYSLENDSDFKSKIIEMDIHGMEMEINQKRINTLISGKFNALNLTAVYASAILLDLEPEKIVMKMSQLVDVEGRFNKIIAKTGQIGIIDYAHTPDALENILEAIEEVNVAGKNVITVIGCGGNRDREKRPLMAKIALEKSHKLILTADNPRNEDPELILQEMEKGIPLHRKMDYLKISDRKSAIRTAVQFSKPGDIILIAGKGHEKYQEINGEKLPFDDKMVLLEAFKDIYDSQQNINPSIN